MKTKIKNISIWVIIWLSFISIGTYAYTTQPWKIGSLFTKIISTNWDDIAWEYRLMWDKIENDTVDDSEIQYNDSYKINKLTVWSATEGVETLNVNWAVRWNQNWALRINTWNWYLDIWPQNSSYSHFYTDRSNYYFNKRITVDEWIISSYNENLTLQTQWTSRVTILNSNWNIWIWTTSPNEKLTINWWDVDVRADTPRIRLTDTWESNKYIEMRYQDGWWRLYTDGSNIYTNRMFRADWGFQVDNKWAISWNNFAHTAQSTVNNHYWYFEVRKSNWTRWAYFGRGNWWDTVNIYSDNASKFLMNQNLQVSWSVKTTCIWNCF
jgi:hypothetical protein